MSPLGHCPDQQREDDSLCPHPQTIQIWSLCLSCCLTHVWSFYLFCCVSIKTNKQKKNKNKQKNIYIYILWGGNLVLGFLYNSLCKFEQSVYTKPCCFVPVVAGMCGGFVPVILHSWMCRETSLLL